MPKPYVPNDKWSQRAAKEGYRARSVYKLMELDARSRLLKGGMTVIDIGAAPGSWLQYVAGVVGPRGKVSGFDLKEIKPVAANVKTHVLDVTDTEMLEKTLRADGIVQADLVLSDIAPNTSGIKDVDQWKSIELSQIVVEIAKKYLRPNGRCVMKVFRGSDFDEFLMQLKREWADVKVKTVQASRDRSMEVYVIISKGTPEIAKPKKD